MIRIKSTTKYVYYTTKYVLIFQAFGSHGMALSENIRETSTIIDSVGGGKSKRLFNSFPQRFEAAFEAELEHFADCLDGKHLMVLCLLSVKVVVEFSFTS